MRGISLYSHSIRELHVMLVEIFWYSVAIFAIWGASLGGVSVPGLGLLYPFRIVSVLLAVFLLFKSNKQDWNIGRKTWFTVFPLVLYLLLFSAVSVFWAADREKTVKTVLNFLYVALFLLLFFRNVKDKKSLDRFLTAISLGFLAILLLGVYETFSGNYLFADPSGVDVSYRTNAYGAFYPVVCFTNPNDYAFAISMITPFMLYVLDEALKWKRWQRTTGKLVVVALSFFNMMNTCSRLGYLVYFVVMMIYLGLQIRKSVIETAFLLVLSCVVALSLAGAFKVDMSNKNSHHRKADPITGIGAQDTSTKIRLSLLEKGLRVTRDTRGLGAGAKNSPAYMAKYTDLPDYGVTDYHFFHMEILADYGVIPLVMLLLFQAGAFAAAVVVLRRKPEQRWLALCVLPGTVGFTLASANCSSCLFLYGMWMQFAVWSLLTAKIGQDKLLKKNI